MAERKPAIKYTSKQFTTIKHDLINYAKRYYPNEFRDFSANSFGSLMLDSVAYVGDILSFYLDYQVNESFLSTAIEYDNVIKLAKQLGYDAALSPASYGILTFFVLIPASNGAPDYNYAPVLKRGSKFSSTTGKIFTLLEDVVFGNIEKNQITVGNVDSETGTPVNYAIRVRGQAISGELAIQEEVITGYEKFRKVNVLGDNITEIVSVTDSEGNPYYEVDYLTQDTIYVPLINRNEDKNTVPNILKPIAVSRRFTVTKEREKIILQFGFGSNENEEEVLDPGNVLLNQHGKKYITDDSFDPAALIKTDKLGISPSDTVLTIIYRINSSDDTNAAANTITQVVENDMDFGNSQTLSQASIATTRDSLEVVNEDPFVGDIPFPSSDEIKLRAFGAYAMQNRIVTKEDFIAATYGMPSNFGAIKKVNVAQDSDTFKQRNINMYVLSADANDKLATASITIKNNLKTWISRYRMINDTIDILDGRIINLGIVFKFAAFSNVDKYTALEIAKNDLQDFFVNRRGYDIGEPFSITDIFAVLKNSSAVLDVIDVSVSVKTGGLYSTTNFNVGENTSSDNRKIFIPTDSCFEIKYPDSDILGEVV